MSSKKERRLKRFKKIRGKISLTQENRLSVFRSCAHIYAQIINVRNGNVVASCSTLDKDIKAQIKSGSNCKAAELVGEGLAKRSLDKGVKNVAFDRSGYKYHGRVKKLAEAVRNNGLVF